MTIQYCFIMFKMQFFIKDKLEINKGFVIMLQF